MGAWGSGSFENDTALDWVADVSRSGNFETVRSALSSARAPEKAERPSFIGRMLGRRPVETYLDADVASEALVAVEIVAFWLGHPAAQFPDELAEWARRHADSFTPDVVTLAREAIASIKTKSELKDLWEEGDGVVAAEWHSAIAELEQRLRN